MTKDTSTGKIEKFVNVLLNNKNTVLILLSIITVIFAFGMTQINVDNDTSKALPDDLKEVLELKKIREKFNSPYSVIFMAQFDTTMTLQEKVALLNKWGTEFEAVTAPHTDKDSGMVKGVQSVAHLGKIKVPLKRFPGTNTVIVKAISEKVSNKNLNKWINANRELTSSFLSEDQSVAVMLIYTNSNADRQSTLGKLQEVLGKIHKEGHTDTYITGATATSWYLNKGMKTNFSILLPIGVFICILILYFIFRRISFITVPLLIIVISIIWTFGFMGFMGIDFTLLSSVIPLILFPIGLADSIHVLKCYNHYRVHDHSFKGSFILAYQELMKAIILTSVTTFFGFASFAISDLKWTQYFGIFTGFGVMLTLVLTVVMLPLLISKRSGSEASDHSDRMISEAIFDKIIFKTPIAWIMLVCAIVFSAIYVKDIKFNNNPIRFFDSDHDVVVSDSIVGEKFGGTRFFDILIEFEDSLKDSTDWLKVREMSEWIKSQNHVGNAISLVPVLERTSQIFEKDTTVRMSNGGINAIFGSVKSDSVSVLKAFITDDHKAIKMSLTLKNLTESNYVELANSIKDHIETNYKGTKVTCGGQALLMDSGLHLLVETQIISLSITFVLVALILMLLFNSFRLGLFTTLPIIISSCFIGGLMSLFGVTINTITVIIINSSVGIGIDYAIHFTAGYLRERKNGDENVPAILHAIKHKGAVIIFNTIAVGVGLLILVFSDFPPIRDLGLFIFLSMAVSSAFSLTFLPLFLNTIKVKERMLKRH